MKYHRLEFTKIRKSFLATAAMATLSLGLVSTPELLSFGSVKAQAVTVFSRIDVSGNQRIASDTIRSIAGIQPGARVTPGEVNDGIQRLNNSGLFAKVDIRPDRGRLVIEVVENPTINRISVEGNKRIDDDVLLGVVTSQPRRAFTAAQAEADTRAIIEAYKASGRVAARVTPKIIRRTDNRVDLVFEVFEGGVVEIKRIGIVGNRKYSDSRLRRVLATKQARRLSFLFKNDTFVQDRIEFDKQLLREFYSKRGHIDFQVVSAISELTRERDAFLLTFKIQEGQQYRFGNVTITSPEPDVDPDAYLRDNDLKVGSVYNPQRVETVLKRMDQRSASNGLPFVQAVPRVTRNNDNRTIDLELELVRGQKVFVERIDIEGNSTTLDRVIRRQFALIEGDALNNREVQLANDRLRALNYFETVEVETREGSSPGQAVIDVNVEEKPTGSLTFGVSFNSTNGVGATIGLTERNFLGRGQTLSAGVSFGQDNEQVNFGLVEPAMFDRDLLAGFDVYFSRVDSGNDGSTLFDTKRIGFTPRIGFPVSENGRLALGYRLSHDTIIIPTSSPASPLIKAEAGGLITSALSATYTYDKRNSVIDPTSGFIASVNLQVAGFGGDTEYVKSWANAKVYKALFNEELVLSAEVEGGLLESFGSGSRIIDRYSLGGDDFRGFENNGLGPRDLTTGDALRGNYYAVARFEASFPLGLPEEYGIYGGLFFDVGSLWGLDRTSAGGVTVDDTAHFRSAVGVSIFWQTQFGPLRFNFARALKKQTYDRTESFRFTVSTRF